MPTRKLDRDYIAECIALKDFTAEEIRIAFGVDANGRGNRQAQRMRRVGIALARDEKLREAMKGKPLYKVLTLIEKHMEGEHYAYD